jgi:hypothetical protein
MTDIALEKFKETRKQLKCAYQELATLQGELITGDAAALDRHSLVMEQIQQLQKTFIEQQEALTVGLPNGKRLRPGQYEALERFASNNELPIDWVLYKTRVVSGFVTECNFSRMKLTTLSGLEGLVRLRQLWVWSNPDLASLKGIPTRAIEVIIADQCGLTGDLSALSGADKLKELNVEGNGGLTSLNGIPTQAIEWINANWCNLTGDHTFLYKAQNLQTLHVENNPDLTLDKTKFSSAVRIVQ